MTEKKETEMGIIDKIKAVLGLGGESPEPGGLVATSHSVRQAALERRRTEINEAHAHRDRDLRAAGAAAKEERDRDLREAEERANATRLTLAAATLAAFYEAVHGHLVSWITEPQRKTAAAIHGEMVRANAIALEQVGAPLHAKAIAFALAEAMGRPDSIVAALAEAMLSTGLATRIAAVSGAPNAAALYDALWELELAFDNLPSREVGEYCRRRYAIAKDGPTDRDVGMALESFDQEAYGRAPEERAADPIDYTPPERGVVHRAVGGKLVPVPTSGVLLNELPSGGASVVG